MPPAVLLQVLQYLSSSTLGAKSSEEHLAALQSKVVIKLDAFKISASTVQKYAAQQQSGGKEVKKGDSKADGFEDKQVAAIKDLIRNQFGTTVVGVSACTPLLAAGRRCVDLSMGDCSVCTAQLEMTRTKNAGCTCRTDLCGLACCVTGLPVAAVAA